MPPRPLVPHASSRPRASWTSGIGWLAAATAVAGVLAWSVGDTWFIDLRVYVLGASHAFDSNLYDQRLSGTGLPFTYPPFAAMVMNPLSHLPFRVTAGVLTAISFVSLFLITRRSLASVRGEACSARTVLVIALAALTLEPVWATFSFGQINLLVVALCLLDLTRQSTRWSGVLTGIAAGLKLTPLFFVAYLLVTRQYRAAAMATGTFLLTVAASFAVNPTAARDFWFDAISDPSRVGAAHYAGNQAISGVLPRLVNGPVDDAILLVLQVCVAVATLACASWMFRKGHRFEAVLGASFGMLAVLMALAVRRRDEVSGTTGMAVRPLAHPTGA